MEYNNIIKNLKSKNYKNLYLFYGKEYFLLDNVVKVLKENIEMKDFNLDIIDGRETSLDKLTTSLETFPFMEDKKIVIVKDFELLKGKKKNFSEDDEKYFINYIKNISESTVLVFLVYGDVDLKKKLAKEIKNIGIVSKNDKIDDITLLKWLRKKFTEQNVEIDNQQIIYFIEQSGYKERNSDKTLSDLENEVKKLSSFVNKNVKITNLDIDKLSQRKIENDIFKLIDYIGNKNATSAIKILNDMISEGESVVLIFVMICRQLKIIIKVNELNKMRLSSKAISEKLKLHNFVVTKAIKQSKNFETHEIIDMINFISDSEYKIKNGILKDVLASEMFVSKYCDVKNNY